MSEDKKKVSHLIGKGYAHIQDGMDRVFGWGFNKLKNLNSSAVKKEENKVIKVSKQIGGFIGEIGSEFYNEYEKLKTKRKDRQPDSEKKE